MRRDTTAGDPWLLLTVIGGGGFLTGFLARATTGVSFSQAFVAGVLGLLALGFLGLLVRALESREGQGEGVAIYPRYTGLGRNAGWTLSRPAVYLLVALGLTGAAIKAWPEPPAPQAPTPPTQAASK
ncbi:MAG: hypothetical protein H6704_15620 [Myxococcales bacterium]|nr:hypothetical protein [Myxococcales bacterium]MCB9537679.1 hypothetical protein [Myxococcales bacterium]